MRASSLIVLAALAPLPALAQGVVDRAEVTVRSGRHPTFTRLTFALPEGMTWQLGRAGGGGYRLLLDRPAQFDTSSVYQRIGTDSVAALVAGPSDLRLDLGCECYAEAFMATPQLLAIDLRPGKPPASARYEQPLQAAAEPHALPAHDDRIDAAVPLVFRPRPTPEPDLSVLEAALIESFARAAAQGLVDPAAPVQTQTVAAAPPLVAPPDQPADAGPVTEAVVAVPGVAAQTSLDRDTGRPAPDRLSRAGEECLPDAGFDFAQWGNGLTLQDAIATGFGALYTVNEAVTREGVATLARSYLHFGFGREAAAITALYPLPDAGVARLAALGRIIDEDLVAPPMFAAQQGCLGAVSLWSALEADALPPLRSEDRIALINALRDLPEPLRGQMGLRLARLFLQVGEVETAQSVMAIGSTAHTFGSEGVASLIADHLGGAAAALSVLRQAQGEGGVLEADSLLAVVDAILVRQEIPPEALLEMVAAARYGARGTAQGADLAAAQTRMLLARSDLATAKAFLSQIDLGLTASGLRDLRDALLSAQAASLPDLAFLTEALSTDAATVGGAAGNAVARRLIDLGFADQALVFLTPAADGPDMAERRYLRAEASALTGQATIGLAALTGLSDPRAEALRLNLSDPVMAVDGDDRAWRSGDWGALAQTDDTLIRAAALEMAAPAPAATSVDSIAQAEALLGDAAAARALANDLLGRFAPPR
ncbi:hypothetical protein BVG79_02078 [Ketogulonicigenium robustum]|uniref:Uncharacterized protein n=1 Tax=Ketogulonicigenium robustum TaxID=92947 RepID=A0A1W6P1M9_9RHOB|nr:hypothetical protein [Ketogulonicigenium robustum]ARO15418.1 hypothetical protein BVG79_02078 [Ketogulonicigenium robustum]